MKKKFKLTKDEYQRMSREPMDLDDALNVLQERLDAEKSDTTSLALTDLNTTLSDPTTWHKRVVVITGASSGLGFAASHCFSLYADIVYNLSRTKGDDDNINYIETDVSNPDAVKEAIRRIYNKEGQIDILINNAGIGLSGAVEELLTTDIVKVMNTNFLGTVSACQAAIPFMREQRQGTILNISCANAATAPAFMSIYAASKQAIQTFTNSLRKEVEPLKINVATIIVPIAHTNFTENRIKQDSQNKAYRYRISNDIGRLEFAEQTGASPENLAEEIYRLCNRRKLPHEVYTLTGKHKGPSIFGRFFNK